MNVKHIVGTLGIVTLSSSLYAAYANDSKSEKNIDNIKDRKTIVDRAIKLKGLQDKSYAEAAIEMDSIINDKKDNIKTIQNDSLKNSNFINAVIDYLNADSEDEYRHEQEYEYDAISYIHK